MSDTTSTPISLTSPSTSNSLMTTQNVVPELTLQLDNAQISQQPPLPAPTLNQPAFPAQLSPPPTVSPVTELVGNQDVTMVDAVLVEPSHHEPGATLASTAGPQASPLAVTSPNPSSPPIPIGLTSPTNLLHAAAEAGDVKKIKELLSRPDISVDAPDDFGQHAIHYAAVFGKDAALEALCEAKADVNGVTSHKTSPLHYAARNGQVKCVELLLKNNANPNAQDSDQWTPLHYACFRGHTQACQLLLDAGATINSAYLPDYYYLLCIVKTVQGHTPLHLACNRGHMELAGLLVRKGADLQITNGHNATPFSIIPLSDKKPQLDMPPSTVDQLLPTLFKDSTYTDITFKTSGAELKAHKCVLAIRCQTLANRFLHEHQPVYDFSTIKWFLEWAYTGKIASLLDPAEDVTAVCDLMCLAKSLAVEELKSICMVHICQKMDVSLAVKVWGLIKDETSSYPLLTSFLAMFSLKHPVELGAKTLWSLPSDALSEILKSLPTEVHTRETGSVAQRGGRAQTQSSSQQGVSGAKSGKLEGGGLRAAKAIISMLRKHRLAAVFNQPVDPVRDGAPDYFSIIIKPMDLGTIKDRLDKGHYKDQNDFVQDVKQVWQNACTYNHPGSEIFRWAQELSAFFDKKLASVSWDGTSAEPSATKKRATPKIPKTAKPMGLEEKRQLGEKMGKLSLPQLARVVEITRTPTSGKPEGEDIELDLNEFDDNILRQLEKYVTSCLEPAAKRAKNKK